MRLMTSARDFTPAPRRGRREACRRHGSQAAPCRSRRRRRYSGWLPERCRSQVERASLLRRCGGNLTVGSNPTLSATHHGPDPEDTTSGSGPWVVTAEVAVRCTANCERATATSGCTVRAPSSGSCHPGTSAVPARRPSWPTDRTPDAARPIRLSADEWVTEVFEHDGPQSWSTARLPPGSGGRARDRYAVARGDRMHSPILVTTFTREEVPSLLHSCDGSS